MANTIDFYFQQIQNEKNNQPTINTLLTNSDGSTTINTEQQLLDQLQSENKVAIWKLWAWITAVQSNFLDQRQDEFKTEIEAIKDSTPVYNSKWWVERAEEWQDGYTLTVDPVTNAIYYDIVDTNAREVEHAAVTDLSGKVVLKIRGKSSDILTAPQLASFTSYIATLKPVGDRVVINNLSADDIKLYYNIYYNPLTDVATITSNVESAINDYLDNIDFNSEVNITDLTDILQQIDGIVDPVFISAEGKHGGASYVAFNNYYTSVAGYGSIDPSYPLSTTIQYIAKTN